MVKLGIVSVKRVLVTYLIAVEIDFINYSTNDSLIDRFFLPIKSSLNGKFRCA